MITQSPYPDDPRVRREAETLEKSGYEVDVLCTFIPGNGKISKFGGVTAYRLFKKYRSKENFINYVFLTFFFFVKAFIKLNKLHKIRDYKAIQIHNMPEFHVFTTILQKLKGVPVILDIHDLTPELFEEKWESKSRFVKPLVKFVEHLSCKYSDKIITVTEGCKEILISRGVPAEKITLVLNTADTSIFKFNTNRKFDVIDKGLKLIYHGTVAHRFGIHIIIEAMPKIINMIPDSKLDVYGEYDSTYKEYLSSRVKELGLEDNVFLVSTKPWEELVQILDDSDIEIVPYLGNKYMHLSLSTKIFECAAEGLPVVSSRLRTLRLAFDDNCIQYFEASNPKDLATKVISICFDPERRKSMALNSYNALNEISGEVMADRYLTLIEEVVGVRKNLSNPQISIPHNG